jgi:hypothetical protein
MTEQPDKEFIEKINRAFKQMFFWGSLAFACSFLMDADLQKMKKIRELMKEREEKKAREQSSAE